MLRRWEGTRVSVPGTEGWYLGQASRSLVNLVSAGFVLFVEVKYHQSCVDFPNRHLVSWREEKARGRRQRPELGGDGDREARKRAAQRGEETSPPRAPPVFSLGCVKSLPHTESVGDFALQGNTMPPSPTTPEH